VLPVLLWSQEVLSKAIIDSGRYCIWERVGTKSFTGLLILLLTLTLAFNLNVQLVKSDFALESEGTVVRVIPEIIEFEGVDVVGQTFGVAVVVENVTNLGGLMVAVNLESTYLDVLSYCVTVPIEDYSTPQTPSPYGGILHSPMMVLDWWDSPPPRYNYLVGSSGPSFNGSGTVLVTTMKVKSQPQPYQDNAVLNLSSLLLHKLELGGEGYDIPYAIIGGKVVIHAFPTHELSVVSIPFTSIPFTIDEVDERTPYRTALPQDSYVLEVPATHNQLVWSHWLEDGDTNRTKTILLDTDITLTAVYARPIGGFSTLIESGYFSSWILLTLLTVLYFTSSIHFKRKHIKARM